MLSSPNPEGSQYSHHHGNVTSGTRPFLASPDGSNRNGPVFDRSEQQQIDENGQEADQEDEDSPMQDSHSSLESNRPPRSPQRGRGGTTSAVAVGSVRVTGSEDLDLKGLDHNGDQIQPPSSSSLQDDSSDDLSDGDRSDQDNSSDTGTAMDEDFDEDHSDEVNSDNDERDDDEYQDIDLDDQDPIMKGFYRDRTLLYERLLEFFAEDVKQPKGDLTDLVKVG
jgi:hypothetical protein